MSKVKKKKSKIILVRKTKSFDGMEQKKLVELVEEVEHKNYLQLRRKEELQKEIDRVFTRIRNSEKPQFSWYGSTDYNLLLESKSFIFNLVKINTEDIFILDVGAGNGNFLSSLLLYISSNLGDIIHERKIILISLTGENMKQFVDVGHNCYHLYLTKVKIENIKKIFDNLVLPEVKIENIEEIPDLSEMNIRLNLRESPLEDIKKIEEKLISNKCDISDKKMNLNEILNLSKEKIKFNWIVSSNCIYHLVDPLGSVENLLNLLKKDGILEIDDIFYNTEIFYKNYKFGVWEPEMEKFVSYEVDDKKYEIDDLKIINSYYFIFTYFLHNLELDFIFRNRKFLISKKKDDISFSEIIYADFKYASNYNIGEGSSHQTATYLYNVDYNPEKIINSKFFKQYREYLKLISKKISVYSKSSSIVNDLRVPSNFEDKVEFYKNCVNLGNENLFKMFCKNFVSNNNVLVSSQTTNVLVTIYSEEKKEIIETSLENFESKLNSAVYYIIENRLSDEIWNPRFYYKNLYLEHLKYDINKDINKDINIFTKISYKDEIDLT